jgi:hypothetical protein
MTRRHVTGLGIGMGIAMVFAPALQLVSAQFPMGPGGPNGTRQVLSQFDKNGDKRLNAEERRAAREALGSFGGGRGGRGGRGFSAVAGSAGPRIDRSSVKAYPATVGFYDPAALRTLFLDFENDDWEKELMAFKDTDIEVPATLWVDGRAYRDVAIQFRGASSFMMVPEGLKHSIDLSMDAWTDGQRLLGFRSLNLLNGNGDPSFLRAMLYLTAARDYAPAARANFVRVVINGESWGIYANVEQVNRDFVEASFKSGDGARWKVPGSPGGRGGLEYFGDDINAYKQTFEIKSKEDAKAWEALVRLTKTLNQTPLERLEAALAPMLDIDNVLKFLAIDVTLVNSDGYWTRASDYNIYLDPKGVFRLIPHDANETFASGGRGGPPPGGPFGFGFGPPPEGGDVLRGAGPGFRRGGPGGPGMPGGRGGRGGPGGEGGPNLDLLVGLADPTKPLRSKLLNVPALRAKYLAYCREIATKWLDWRTLEPMVSSAHALIGADIKTDTRKLWTNEAFDASRAELKAFADARRAYVLAYAAPNP